MKWLSLILVLTAGMASSQTVVAVSAIRSQTIITAELVALLPDASSGPFSRISDVIGQEARVNIYPGRPIMPEELGRPAILERNQQVVMIYARGLLSITSEGRVLDRAGIGERVRVMNLASKSVVFGTVTADGKVKVGDI